MNGDAPSGATPKADGRLAIVRDVFAAASELEGAERDRYLDQACAGNAELRGEVGNLLARQAELGAFLAQPLAVPPSFAARQSLALPGDQIGGFEVLQFLARGGSGEVYRARQAESGRDVALKLISTADLAEHARERFAREARIAQQIRHPHLVEVLAFGEERALGLLYLAMRFVPGPTLAELLADFVRLGTKPDSTCRPPLITRFREVARALAALHEQRVVHRDVKPANIMFDGRGEPAWAQPAILVDLGLARDLHGDHSSSVWLAFGYAPPERVDGRMDETGDVYSLGLTMYDVFAGGTPALRSRWARAPLPPLSSLVPDIDPDLARVVATATDPDPRWRYAHAGLLADDLDAVLARRRIAERRGAIVRRAWRRARRNPRRAFALLVLSIVVLTALALAVLSVLEASRAAATARDAYRRGDLVTVERVLATAPRLASIWIPRQVAQLAETPRGDPTPEQRVFDLVPRDRAAACKLAACYVARDGLEANPLLASFLLHELHTGAAAPARWATRLFRERPDVNPRAHAASAELRRWFASTMRSAASPAAALHALSALGGCGDAESAREILAWVSSGFAGMIAREQLEARRLAALTLAHITARSGPCGFAAGLADVLTREALQPLVPAPGQQSAPHAEVVSACSHLALHRSLLRRARALPPDPLWDALLAPDALLRVRAARADPELVAELRRGAGAVRALLAERSPHLDPDHECGFLAGAVGDGQLTELLEAAVSTRPGCDGTRAKKRFRDGCASAHAIAAGCDPFFALDADTHLSAELEHPAESRDLEVVRVPSEPPVVASWEFVAEPFTMSGSADGCAALGVAMGYDEWMADARYARMHLPGVSAVRVPFEVRPIQGGFLTLKIDAQKNARATLPWQGIAMLEVWLDGEHVDDLRLVATSHQHFSTPLCLAHERHRRTLEIRLGANSETPVRLYRVQIVE
jgi:hypothetical protein